MANKPNNMVQALREVIPCIGLMGENYPEWFREMGTGQSPWITLLSSAADELEGMQKLNGKLYKTLYPD